MKVKIHREGQNIIVVLLLILLAINIPAYLFMELKWIPITLSVISVITFALVVNFFRLPQRHFKGDSDGVVVSSVDGKVVALEEVYEGEYLHKNVIQLSVFMSVFNGYCDKKRQEWRGCACASDCWCHSTSHCYLCRRR